MKFTARLLTLGLVFLIVSPSARSFTIPEDASETFRERFARFATFRIQGVCGDRDLERLATLGVNTVRGYTLGTPEEMRKKLDHAHRLGLKMIVSEWMPHQGRNTNKEGLFWDFDYNVKGDQMVESLIRRVEGIGDHPALLMWGLGNEVHLDEPYLRVVNRMSEEIHKRFPHHLTSLTMVNAKPEAIAAVKKFAPDLDVIGIQSYSRGAVRGAIKKTEELWGKPFYVSEFNANGPWNFKETAWGARLDEPVEKKVNDLKDCYAAIDASPLCLGSTIFVWGHYAVDDRPTYFSLLLHPHPEGPGPARSFDGKLMTPQADAMVEHFRGRMITGNRAPILTKLEFDGGANQKAAQPGEALTVRFAAEDSNGDPIEFVPWILQAGTKKTTVVAGPFAQNSPDHAVLIAPNTPGAYLVMVYAKDGRGGASATVLPFQVPSPEPAPILADDGKPYLTPPQLRGEKIHDRVGPGRVEP
jgi:hypothetical protein